MGNTLFSLLRWTPRILGIAVALFIGLFALDAFAEGKPLREAIPDFLIHLVPTALLLLTVFVSWRRGWIGAIVFVALAVAYASMVPNRPDWILIIAGPLFVVGLLFFWSWRSAGPTGSIQGP